ncbi:hypothetical protein Tco_0575622 [Tanacetum coccineum]
MRPRARRVETISVDGLRRTSRPSLRLEDILKLDLKKLLLSKNMTYDRNSWKLGLEVKQFGPQLPMSKGLCLKWDLAQDCNGSVMLQVNFAQL